MTGNQDEVIQKIAHSFPFLNPSLQQEMAQSATLGRFEAGTTLVKEGQYIKLIPLVLNGVLKVFTSKEDKDLLLYYIKKEESCIMSFAAGLNNEPSKVFAITQDASEVLLFPIDKVLHWVDVYPEFAKLFFGQYYLRYSDLLQTIQQVVFEKLDTRILAFLKERAGIFGSNHIKISHKQMAQELGTAREVVTRILKKLEVEGKILQHPGLIEIL
jgi:CRP/FNR family transcriptional regulator